MRHNHTHITVILDRSGSMEPISRDVIAGFNNFIDDQKAQPGSASLSLVQFDSQDPYDVIYDREPIEFIAPLDNTVYVPRSKTPLLDAIGRAVIDLELNLRRTPAHELPDRIIVVVISDGKENASAEFGHRQVRSMIKRKQREDGWQIVFLSADLDALNEAVELGVSTESAMAFDKNAMGTTTSWDSVSSRISDYRGAQASGIAFSDEDRVRQASDWARIKRGH